MQGYVHSFDTGAAADGPGIRFALFLAGCPFKCLYCHNPDTWEMKNGKPTHSQEIIDEISKYAGFLRMAGGLTITGGEPLAQPEFAHEIFERAKNQLGLHTALDTQGFLAGHLSDEWFNVVDLVMLDIKEMNPTTYLKLTGKPLQPTLDFAQRLEEMGKSFWLRYVLVPGLTDNPDDVQALANFIRPFKHLKRIDVLPFHNMAIHKWDELGYPYTLKNTRSPSAEEVAAVKKILEG